MNNNSFKSYLLITKAQVVEVKGILLHNFEFDFEYNKWIDLNDETVLELSIRDDDGSYETIEFTKQSFENSLINDNIIILKDSKGKEISIECFKLSKFSLKD